MPLPLTIVTAVLNEEKILPKFLEHATSIANEVIVVIDFRNSDKSVDIAKKYGCRVLVDKGESEGIVFNNKNWGIKEAKNDWVMIVDADERLDSTLQKEVAKIVQDKSIDIPNIYQTSFINYEFGKLFTQSDQKQKPFVRLFKKGTFGYNTDKTSEGFGIQTSSITHHNKIGKILLKIPKVRTWYLKSKGGVVTLKGHLIHFTHPTLSEFIRKIDLYSTREAKIIYKNKPQSSSISIIYRLFKDPILEFLYKFFVWKLYKEGIHGYIASVIYSFYHFLIIAKYYRYIYRDKHLKEIENLSKKYSFEDL